MGTVKYLIGLSILFLISINRSQATCVFASDYGFTLDCAFKKSGLFRVRNLGGVKAHFGLGFSVGDELGFGQSLSNLDSSKRRSVSSRNGGNALGAAIVQQQQQQTNQRNNAQNVKRNRLTVRQPSTSAAPMTQSTASSIASSVIPPISSSSQTPVQTGRSQSVVRQMKQPAGPLPSFKPMPPAQDMLAPSPTKQSQYPIPAQMSSKGTITALPNPHQRNAPQTPQGNLNRIGQAAKNNNNFMSVSAPPVRVANIGQNLMSVNNQNYFGSNSGNQALRTIPAPSMSGMAPPNFPSFNSMPSSVSRISTSASYQVDDSPQSNSGVSVVSPQAYRNTVQVPVAPTMMSKYPTVASFTQNTISLRKLPVSQTPAYPIQSPQSQAYYAQQQKNQLSANQLSVMMQNSGQYNNNYASKPTQKIDNMITYNAINDYNPQASLYQKIVAISKATNISVEAIEAAVKLRQQQLINQMISAQTVSTTTTTTTTTPRPPPPPPPQKRYQPPPAQLNPVSKVMNAPKEYYPVGYDKNFDDNFVSKVELPDTSFYCGDQKHFPGLYGDEDLGCMVFHVCALTDEGLIMKSFLCPESTLFDQTILKCNWWFYVDCKSSKGLYDSNIPISKKLSIDESFDILFIVQKEIAPTDENSNLARSTITENTSGVKDAVKILHEQSRMELPKVEILEVKSNRPYVTVPSTTPTPIVTRSNNDFSPVNVNDINGLSVAVNEKENVAVEREEKIERRRKFRQNQIKSSETRFDETQERIQNNNTRVEAEDITQSIITAPVTSTEKSTEISTSVERNKKRRRLITKFTVENETVSKSTDLKDENDSNFGQRFERASQETVNDEVQPLVSEPVADAPKSPEYSSYTSSSEVRKEVEDTIAKMDRAIIGQQNREFT